MNVVPDVLKKLLLSESFTHQKGTDVNGEWENHKSRAMSTASFGIGNAINE